MTTPRRAALCLRLLLPCLAWTFDFLAAERTTYEAGAAHIDITPEGPIRLSGHPGRVTPSEGIESRLHARVLVLRDAGGVLTVLVSVESLGISSWLRERVCGVIRESTGVYRHRIAFCATGTRSAPALRGIDDDLAELTPGQARAIRQHSARIVSAIVSGVREAIRKLKPVDIAFSVDPAFLVARGKGGELTAIVFPGAAVGNSRGADFNRVCGDWPGHVAAALEERFPGCVALPLFSDPGATGVREEGAGTPSSIERDSAAAARRLSAALGGRLEVIDVPVDARLEYAELTRGETTRRHAVQVFSLDDRFAMVFLPGAASPEYGVRLRSPTTAREIWIVARANDETVKTVAVEKAILDRANELLESSPGAPGARLRPPPPTSPLEALDTISVAPGFRVELVAAEPEVVDPVAITFDAHGAMYVCEMRDYPLGGPGSKGGGPFDGRVRRLEDHDGNGYYESSTVFATDLAYPCGITCWRDGVLVAATTEIVLLEDGDGDGHADLRRVICAGFKTGNSQHLLNSLEWSIDNWIYVNGSEGASVQDPLDPGALALTLRYSNFRFDPRGMRIERTTGYRGGYGIAFDLDAARIVCSSTNHGRHVVFDLPALQRNPDLAAGNIFHTLSDHDQWIHPASVPLERFNDPMDSGRFSSACGVHVYNGDRLPPSHRGSLFVCEPVSNLVHRDKLVRMGATIVARRGEHDTEFLTSTDHWFRPVQCTTGPDGALYIADIYREVIEHPEWIPVHVQKLFDLRSGMDRGRIYRVVHDEIASRQDVADLARASPAMLVEALGHESHWQRRTAQRLLVERQDTAPLAALGRVLRHETASAGDSSEWRRHALWTLSGLGALTPELLALALGDDDGGVRAHAVQLAEDALRKPGPRGRAVQSLAARVRALAVDPDPRVRFRVALALGALAGEERVGPLADVALRDATDPWMCTAVLTSMTAAVDAFLRRLLQSPRSGDHLAPLVERVAELVGNRRRPAEICAVIDLLTTGIDGAGAWRTSAVARLLGALGTSRLGEFLAADGDRDRASRVRENLDRLFRTVARRAASDGESLAARIDAVELLGHHDPGAALALLRSFLGSAFPPSLQIAAVRSLSNLLRAGAREEVLATLLADFDQRSPTVRGEILDTILADVESLPTLLAALEDGAVKTRTIDAPKWQLLLSRAGDELAARARTVLGAIEVDADRAAVVETYRRKMASLGGKPDERRGKDVFVKNCSVCHRHAGAGAVVGPDLASVVQRPADALIIDILDPNRSVSPQYVGYTVLTRSGVVLGGLLISETPSSVLLRRAEGKTDSILRRDLLEFRATGLSVMPTGLEKEISPTQMRDLIAYLKLGPQQARRLEESPEADDG